MNVNFIDPLGYCLLAATDCLNVFSAFNRVCFLNRLCQYCPCLIMFVRVLCLLDVLFKDKERKNDFTVNLIWVMTVMSGI